MHISFLRYAVSRELSGSRFYTFLHLTEILRCQIQYSDCTVCAFVTHLKNICLNWWMSSITARWVQVAESFSKKPSASWELQPQSPATVFVARGQHNWIRRCSSTFCHEMVVVVRLYGTEPKSCNVGILRCRHALLRNSGRCSSLSQWFIIWNKVQLRTSPRNCGSSGFPVSCQTVVGNIGLPWNGTRLFSFVTPWCDGAVCSSAVIAELWGYFSTGCGTSERAYTALSCCGLKRW